MSNQPNYQRMFEAACVALGEVGDALGCDPNEGGAEPILDAIEKLKAERNHWKANHDAQVQRARVLIDRPDIPLERVKAYEQIGVLTSERDEWKSKHFAFKDRDDMRNDAELYRHLRDIPPNPFRLMMWEAADMLAADAQTSPSHPQFVAGFKAGHAAGKRREDAQQMAILQEKDKLFEGLSTGQVMQKAFAWCPTDHPHKLRMQWIADYFIANAPQADALAADHVEDVRAMVPMTDQELDDLLPTNDSMSRKDSQRWIARATERHHKIGVKP